MIEQIVGLFHKLLLMVLFRHMICRSIHNFSYQETQKSEEGSVIKTDLCQKFTACSFPVEGNVKAVDAVPLALDRYVLALGFCNRKINCLIEISLDPLLQSDKSPLYNT